MAQNSLRRPRVDLRQLSANSLIIILVAAFLLILCLYVYVGICRYDDDTLRIMTTVYSERYAEIYKNEPIKPSVAERTAATLRDYPLTMLFLVGSFLALSWWNQKKQANLQATLCAIFLLLGIGCSTKVLFQGFYGLSGESGFIVMGCFVMLTTFFLWRWMRGQLPSILYGILVLLIVTMIALNTYLVIKYFMAKLAEDSNTSSDVVNGAANWIQLGSIRFQPSEFIKSGLILLGSCSSYPKHRKIVYVVLSAVGCMVVALAGDIGSAAVMAVLFFFMVWLLFDEERYSIPLFILFVLALIVVFKFHPTANARYENWGQAMTPAGNGQQRQFLSALVRGGWFGHGMKGALDYFQITAAGTDGILGCIQAVFGMPMLITTMGCYVILVLQCGFSRNVNPSAHPILLQMALMLTTHIVLNYGGSLDLLPFTGITAPLLSQGGTSTLCNMALIGVMGAALYASVDGPSKKKETEDFFR